MSYDKAFKEVAAIEGGYVNDPQDTGGETYKGISRVNHPKWLGWHVIDQYKNRGGFPGTLDKDPALQDYIKQWYKETYWDKFNLDNCSDEVALEIFEQAVNLGIGQTTKHIQRVCNAFNNNLSYGQDVTVDGAVGPKTNARLREVDLTLGSKYKKPILREALNALQGAFYTELANGTKGVSNYRKFFAGWILNRVA